MPGRLLPILALSTLLLTVTYFILSRQAVTSKAQPQLAALEYAAFPPEQHSNFTIDVDILKQFTDLPGTFEYQRYCVLAKESPKLRRESVVGFKEDFLDEQATNEISLNDEALFGQDSLFPACRSSLTLEVPEFTSREHKDTKSLMLGVATTLKRIEQSLPNLSRWLSNTGSQLVVLLVDQPEIDNTNENIIRIDDLASNLAISLILEPYVPASRHDSEGMKNFGLATALDKHQREETKWFGVIDDDTFFFSLSRMVEHLAPYDHQQQWYIGALTEGHTRVAREGFKAWGGAGFFISPPLMRILAKNSEQCMSLGKKFGDILWRDCILQVTSPTVRLTEMKGLNQLDLWNDVSGWYEAGFDPILTVHHWKSWHYFPIAASHLVTDVAGTDSLLQRYLFGNNTVFTNGYSIVQYPRGIPDLNLVELTMTEDKYVRRPPGSLEFHHSFGKTRPALEAGTEKISWRFEYAMKTEDGTVRQFYVRRTWRDPNGDGPVESIIEVDWRHVR